MELAWALFLGLALPAVAVPAKVVVDRPSVTLKARQAANTDLALKRDWNIDGTDVTQLGLQKSAKMLWTLDSVPLGQSPDLEREAYAWMTMDTTEYPMLLPSNSDYINKVECDLAAGWIKMTFSEQTAYDWAWDNWNERRDEWGDYVVVTAESSCKAWDSGSTANWLRATSEAKDDRTKTITCTVEDISFPDAVGDEPIDVEFENFNQNDVSATATDFPGSDGYDDLGGEVLDDPSGDTGFDRYLDFNIGKMNQETFEATNLASFNLTLDDFFGDDRDLPDLAEENIIARRGLFKRVRNAARKVKKAVKKAATAVKAVAKKVGEAVVEAAKEIEQFIADFTTVNQVISQDIEVDTTTHGSIVTTQFDGRLGYKLFSGTVDKELADGSTAEGSVEAFCVDCFVEFDLRLGGQIRFVVSQLTLEEGFISLDGTAAAGLGLGLVAEFAANKEVKKQIVSIPLTPFAIPGIFVLGPKLDLSAGVEFDLGIEGSVLAGVQLEWPEISARVDVNGGSFARGFTPEVTPILEVAGEVSLTATIFIEKALGFGIDIGNGLFDKSVEMVVKPFVFVTGTLGGGFDLGNGGGFSSGEDECAGVSLVTGIGIEVFVNVFDIKRNNSVLFELSEPLDDRCFEIGSSKRANVPTLPAVPHARRQEAAEIGDTTFPDGKMSRLFTRDPSESFRLRYSPNGNTYAVSESKVPDYARDDEWSGWFSADSSGTFVYGDSHGRFFHGYSDTLESLGVSRLRLHSPDDMPIPAWPVVWASVVEEDEPEEFDEIPSDMPFMMIADLAGDVYFPVHCVYSSEEVYGKIFVVKDVDAGIETLMSNAADVLAKVTGDPVVECGYVAITNGLRGVDVAEGEDLDDEDS